MQAPLHTVAQRNKKFEKIYGQSGDEIIDNESYDNVDFSVKICFLPLLTQSTAKELAYAVIDWLATRQDGYYEYRDTYNDGYFTKASLTNFNEIVRELPTLLTATLKFNRMPFWYRDDGLIATTFNVGGTDNTLINPEPYDSEPVYQFWQGALGGVNVTIIVNGIAVSEVLPVEVETAYYDNVQKQLYRVSNGAKIYISSTMLPNLQPGTNVIRFSRNGVGTGSFNLKVIPNWRRL